LLWHFLARKGLCGHVVTNHCVADSPVLRFATASALFDMEMSVGLWAWTGIYDWGQRDWVSCRWAATFCIIWTPVVETTNEM